MNDVFQPPSTCHICDSPLQPHPLYAASGAQVCSRDGDFFIQRQNGHEPSIIFRPFDHAPEIKPPRREKPVILREKSPEEKSAKKLPLASRINWVLLDQEEYLDSIKTAAVRKGMKGRPGVIVRCDQTGQIFPSIREMGAELGVDRQTIFKYFKGERKSVGGYTFTKLDDPYEHRSPRRGPVLSITNHHAAYAIKCEQTGRIFPSMRIAAKEMNLDRNSVRKQVAGKLHDVYGYTFVRVDSEGSQKLQGSI